MSDDGRDATLAQSHAATAGAMRSLQSKIRYPHGIAVLGMGISECFGGYISAEKGVGIR